MTDEEFIRLSAECIRGEHGEVARIAASVSYTCSIMLGAVMSAFRRFPDDVDTELETQEEHRIMDLMSLPLGENQRQ